MWVWWLRQINIHQHPMPTAGLVPADMMKSIPDPSNAQNDPGLSIDPITVGKCPFLF